MKTSYFTYFENNLLKSVALSGQQTLVELHASRM